MANKSCSSCFVGKNLCLATGLDVDEVSQLDGLVQSRLRVRRGRDVFTKGDALSAIYSVFTGSVATHSALQDGRIQITAIAPVGHFIGLEAIADDKHSNTATAMEDSELCVIPFEELRKLSIHLPTLQHTLLRIMSQNLRDDRQQLLCLGVMRAEERLATFLISLSNTFAERGLSPNEFTLRMSREEIGQYLGLKLETVSRLFSKFAELGILQIQQRDVKILDRQTLENLLQGEQRLN